MIKRSVVFSHIFSLIILFPVIFSFLFSVSGLGIPSYLFISILCFSVIFLIASDIISFSVNALRICIFIFFGWIFFSLSFTPSVLASKEKAIAIMYNTIIPISIIQLFFTFSKKKTIDLLAFNNTIVSYSYLLIWFSFFAYLVFRVPDVSGRYSLPGVDNAIWFSRFVGMLLVIVLCCSRINIKNMTSFILTVLIALALLFGGGSRGPVLSVLIVFFVRQSYFISKKKLLITIAIIAGIISVGFIFVGGYLFETDFYSIYARLDLFKAFSDYDFQYIKGAGIGSYALSFFGEDIVYYPHNIFLELFFENGLIGVFLFIIVLFLFFKSFKPNILNLLCLYYFLASLVSGDIPGNNNLFILLFISTYVKQDIFEMKDKKMKMVI